MTMFTRCTHCGATFRVTLEQLQTSSGQVRCGVCDDVFDAFVALSANDPRSTPAPIGPEPERPPPSAEEMPAAVVVAPSESLDLDLSEGAPAAVELVIGEAVPGSAPEHPRPPADTVRPFDFEGIAPVATRAPAPTVWIASAVVLALAFIVQGVYFLRDEIAAYLPDTRPPLEALCAWLGCDLPLPRLADRLSIEASDLQALDPARPGRVVLSATIRNRAGMIQAWPMLELTLTNSRDQVAARKVFAPDEYMNDGSPARGFAANAEAAIRLRLDTGDIVAAGYRIYLFHP